MSTSNIFGNPHVYMDVNSEAQKRACVSIKAPALTWHMALLTPNFARGQHLPKYLDQLAEKIIAGLFKRAGRDCTSPVVHPAIDERIMLFSKLGSYDYQTGAVEDATDRATKREEWFLPTDERFLTFSFDTNLVNAVRDWGWQHVTVVVKKFVNLFTISVVAESRSLQCSLESAAAFEAHTISFWDDFSEFLYGLDDDISRLFASGVFRHVFADLRGIVIGAHELDFQDFDVSLASAPDWASPYIVTRLRSLVTRGDRHECTASYLLDGKALLLTAMGPQELDYAESKRQPLTYLLCPHVASATSSTRLDPAQLGRLIDRFHIAEMLRHAALLDLPLLWEASQGLATIDPFMRKARTVLERADTRMQIEKRALTRIRSARRRLNAIASNFQTSRRNVARNGLSLRIENSRYYVSQFMLHLPPLRLKRVEGYRRYDEFVQRRLGATFDFINRLGIRYERASAVMASIEQGLVTAMAREAGEDLKEIQRYGELVLFLVLVPYYTFAVLEHFEKLKSHDKYAAFVAVTVYTSLASFAVLRFFERKSHRRYAFFACIVSWIFMSAYIALNNQKLHKDGTALTIIFLAAVVCFVYPASRLFSRPSGYAIFNTLALLAGACFLAGAVYLKWPR